MWLSIGDRLADTNRYQLTYFINWYQLIGCLTDHRFPSIGYPGVKSLQAYLAKRLFDSVEVLNLRKKLISINWKKKFKRLLSFFFGGRRKVQVPKFAFEDFIFIGFCCELGRHIAKYQQKKMGSSARGRGRQRWQLCQLAYTSQLHWSLIPWFLSFSDFCLPFKVLDIFFQSFAVSFKSDASPSKLFLFSHVRPRRPVNHVIEPHGVQQRLRWA